MQFYSPFTRWFYPLLTLVGALACAVLLTVGVLRGDGIYMRPVFRILFGSLMVLVCVGLGSHLWISKHEGDEADAKEPPILRILAILCAICAVIVTIVCFGDAPRSAAGGNPMITPRTLGIVGVCFLFTCLYFLLVAANGDKPSVGRGITGIAVSVTHLLFTMLLYFDTHTHANAPIKVVTISAFLFSLLHMLSEVRISLGMPISPFAPTLCRITSVVLASASLLGLSNYSTWENGFGIWPYVYLAVLFLYIYIRGLFMPRPGLKIEDPSPETDSEIVPPSQDEETPSQEDPQQTEGIYCENAPLEEDTPDIATESEDIL